MDSEMEMEQQIRVNVQEREFEKGHQWQLNQHAHPTAFHSKPDNFLVLFFWWEY